MTKEKGFTIIEIIVSVAILAIVSTTILLIVFTTLRSSTKTEVHQEIKQNGETAVTMISDFIRRAETVSCSATTKDFLNVGTSDGKTTSFSCESEKIASRSGSIAVNLTSESVKCNNMQFSCVEKGGYPSISFSFSLFSKRPGFETQEHFFVGRALLLKKSR